MKNISDDQKVKFYDKLIDSYVSPSFGALPKKEVEILVLKLLIEAGVFGEKLDTYTLSRELCIPVSKAKSLYYEYQLRNSEYNPNQIIELLKNAQIILIDKKAVIQIGVDSIFIKNQLEALIKELNDYPDYSFNKDILKFNVETYINIINKLSNEDHIKEIEKEILSAVKLMTQDQSYIPKTRTELFDLFLVEVIKATGNEFGKTVIDLTFGYLDGGIRFVSEIIKNHIK